MEATNSTQNDSLGNLNKISPALSEDKELKITSIPTLKIVSAIEEHKSVSKLSEFLTKPRLVVPNDRYLAAYRLDVSNQVEVKNNFNYLSWAFALKYFTEHFPEYTYGIVEDYEGVLYSETPNEEAYLRMFIADLTLSTISYPLLFPVLDFRNKPVKNPSSMEINTARMRGLTKAIAVATGLGATLYTQEDLPKEDPELKLKLIERINSLYTEYVGNRVIPDSVLSVIDNLNTLTETQLKTVGLALKNSPAMSETKFGNNTNTKSDSIIGDMGPMNDPTNEDLEDVSNGDKASPTKFPM